MSIVSFKALRLSTLGMLFLSFVPVGRAQFANLDRVGEQLAKQLRPLKPRMIAAADFAASQGAVPEQGHYFSGFLSNAIQRHDKKLPIFSHADFETELQGNNVSPDSFMSANAVSALRTKIPEDILIIGTVVRKEQGYFIAVSAVRVFSGEVLFSTSTTLPRTEFLDSFSDPFPPKLDSPIFQFNAVGIVAPVCVHCPTPAYNHYARQDKLQNRCAFNILVSPEGYVAGLKPTQLCGDGLDDEAFKTIKTWKFKPATNKEGNAVYVLVPVELSFSLF